MTMNLALNNIGNLMSQHLPTLRRLKVQTEIEMLRTHTRHDHYLRVTSLKMPIINHRIQKELITINEKNI